MNTFLEDVSKFHLKFNSPILAKPTANIPTERKLLRLSLLSEELGELEEAIENEDIVEIADALCDLQYVLSGAVLEFGLGSRFDALFAEVQRSNMSKACANEDIAKATVHQYELAGVNCTYKPNSDGTYNVYRDTDSKLLKSIEYSPANLEQFIEP